MLYQSYNHNGAEEIIPGRILSEITGLIQNLGTDFRRAPDLREAFLEGLATKGWPGEVHVDSAVKITITSVKDGCGLCLQFGNMARFYADLLKLQHLFGTGKIKAAVYILPEINMAKNLGSNLANFDRFTKELAVFKSTITVPLMVYGLWER